MSKRQKTAGKRRRSVRCTMCTQHRWLGNAKGRFATKEELKRQELTKDIASYGANDDKLGR